MGAIVRGETAQHNRGCTPPPTAVRPVLYWAAMNAAHFRMLYRGHRDKLFEAWNRLPQQEFDAIGGDLARFVALVERVYRTPGTGVLHELDAVQRNIDAGIVADYAPVLPVEE